MVTGRYTGESREYNDTYEYSWFGSVLYVLCGDFMTEPTEGLEVIHPGPATVTECPVWDDQTQALWWVDIYNGLVNRFSWSERSVSFNEVGAPVTCLAPRANGGLVTAKQGGIWAAYEDENGHLALEQEPIPGTATPVAGTRFNDGRCDLRGRFWIGTILNGAPDGSGGLYVLQPPDPLRNVLSGANVSNGLDWNRDGTILYYADSATRRVDAIECDPDTGTLGERRPLAWIEPDAGAPDGLTVDSEDNIWVALSGGWQVRCYRPGGELTRVIQLPVARVTSCTFGGPSLTDLFITSARRRLSDAELAAQPLAGSVFRINLDVAGRPAARFAG
jgi:sugar lactone lactonase YvrE